MNNPTYSSFQRHISRFTTTNTLILTPYQSLKTFLSLGLDFPVALVSCLSLPLLYGNCGFLYTSINISKIPSEKQPTQLENVRLEKESYTRDEFLRLLYRDKENPSWVDKGHLLGYWTLAAGTRGHWEGRIARKDVEAIQRGDLVDVLKERRKGREDVLPLRRGGPISVAGHSWFVDKLFGVKVYQRGDKED